MNKLKAIDIHVYYGHYYFAQLDYSISDLMRRMDQWNIEKAIVMSYLSLMGDFRRGDRQLFESIKGNDRLFGYCYVNGNYMAESAEHMARYLGLPECRGVKFHPEYSAKRPDDSDILPLFEKVAHEYQKPALIHSWPVGEHGNVSPGSHPRFIAELARRVPELTVIMGHMGGDQWCQAIELAKPYPNLYLDTVCTYTDYDKVKAAVDGLGRERLLLGTGGGFSSQVPVVLDSQISDEDKRFVLYENARRIFCF